MAKSLSRRISGSGGSKDATVEGAFIEFWKKSGGRFRPPSSQVLA
jgi:hypothetical protein